MAAPLSIIEGQIDEWFAARRYETVTITIAAPGVLSKDSHGLQTNDRVKLFTSGSLPTGLSTNTFYFVIYVTEHTFQLSATRDGSAITTTGSQTGTHYYAADKNVRVRPAFQNNK